MNPLFQETLLRVRARLLAERGAHGHWEGELSSSALATATAVMALALADRAKHTTLIRRGLHWLTTHANADGGWGDTVLSHSNISATTLGWAALGLLNESCPAAEQWLEKIIGCQPPAVSGRQTNSCQPSSISQQASALVAAIAARYGKDRTFSVPILTACALAGRISWEQVPPLPFELAALPHQLFKWLRLPVVSYALPALIAIGQVRHHHLPARRWLRDRVCAAALHVLEKIQPSNGGFLEAPPLTSFVVMSLAGMGLGGCPVVERGVRFLTTSVRADGSWPIDSNLATWLTTLAVNALGPACRGAALLRPPSVENATQNGCSKAAPLGEVLKDWLLGQQYHAEHPYTHAAPGGWAWTDLPGGVPDADDTAGALLALKFLTTENTEEEKGHRNGNLLRPSEASVSSVVNSGIEWLLDLQNRDGGIPTFCRGWGALPFDRSAPDLTAHALRAFVAWRAELPSALQARVHRATQRAVRYLAAVQRSNGTWAPLWFGNQDAPGEENLTYGTAQVLRGLQVLDNPQTTPLQQRAIVWLLATQDSDGSWGGATGTPPAIEETALAVNALAGVPEARAAVARGVDWLIARTEAGRSTPAAPIGLYFAKLWYFERLYPLVYLAAALERFAVLHALEK